MAEVMTQAPDGTPCHPMVLAVDDMEGWAGWHTMTCMDCGRSVSFVSATPERVQWFVSSHRCGPGRGWQGGA